MLAMVELFAIRMRAYAAAHFAFSDVLTLTWPDAQVWLQSEYTGGRDGRAYAVTIHGEIRGLADSIDDAQRRLSAVLTGILQAVALAGNAAVATPLMISAHGMDLSHPQPFLGYRTPDGPEWFPPGNRRIDTAPVLAVIMALDTAYNAPGGVHLGRAVESYQRALGHWVPEERLLAGEFLAIAAEALSRFAIESRAHQLGMTPKNLAQLRHAVDERELRRRFLADEVFTGDSGAEVAMREASNGFEHGYMQLRDVQGLLEPVLERSMGHVRRELVEALGLAPEAGRRLLDETYDEPRGLVPPIWVVGGELSRGDPAQDVPPMDGAPIELAWKGAPLVADTTADGEVVITFPLTNITVERLPSNVSLGLTRVGLRAAHLRPTSADPVAVTITRAAAVDPEGSAEVGVDPASHEGSEGDPG
jgi:hypothetical protein